MTNGPGNGLMVEQLRHPLLTNLSALAERLIGIRFLVVFPSGKGWGQAGAGGGNSMPEFCRLIQGTMEGVKHCQMCHVLMAVAASRERLTEQRCHAGASVLVTPITLDAGERFAILGTCTFVRDTGPDVWKEIRDRGRTLGINLNHLRKYYSALPDLSPEDIKTARAIMEVIGEAVKEIRARSTAETRLTDLRSHREAKTGIGAAVENGLRENGSSTDTRSADQALRAKRKIPVLIEVVTDLIQRNPSMPFNVGEIAAAARMTPNHFSTLFRQYTGQSFMDFLTDRRISLAKELLGDLTLNVGEVALAAGFDDPSYFTRRFRQKTGMTPTDFRNKTA